jgi:beta-phosphoglucomutase-like phosphatase (HAD superfamily)
MRIEPSFLFDLDGTLVDSVYQHVLACSRSGVFIARSA